MRLPWQSLTGLAKSAAIFASMLVISIGLCGANAFLYGRFVNYEKASALGTLLLITGIVEAGVIVLSGVGVIGVVVVSLARWIHHRFFPNLK